MSLPVFFNSLTENGYALFTVLLISGVIFVNGWTDAPTAVATGISTKAIKPGRAIFSAAVMNFFGALIMSKLNGRVAQTIENIASFAGDSHKASIALCAALLSIVIWSVAAWFFGIPTSESHALVASLSGAAAALNKSLEGISREEWRKVIFGLVFSTFLGFVLGFLFAKAVTFLIKNRDRSKTEKYFVFLQKFSASFMAFMHGAQDGQKFIGVFMLAVSLTGGETAANGEIPLWMIIYCSLLMAAGTSIGGMRIIKSMGSDMVRLQKYQGFSADLAGAVSLLASTLRGLPVSTTHAKTTAIMGVGGAKKLSDVDWKIAGNMLLTWILTFPGCGFLGYLTTVILLKIW